MPRKSAASLAIVPINAARKPLEPPSTLRLPVEVVESCDPSHFRKSDVALLTTYCTAVYLTRFYSGLIGEDPATSTHSARPLRGRMGARIRL